MDMWINDQIKIKSDFSFQSVISFDISWNVNSHSILLLAGILNSQSDREQIESGNIKIYMIEEKEEKVLFHGYIDDLEITYAGNVSRIMIRGISASCLLDKERQSHSYQDTKATYAQIAKEAVRTAGGDIICTIGKEETIGFPVIQYKETSWQFVKRIASHMGKFVVPDIVTGEPAIWFGMRNGDNVGEIYGQEYIVEIHNQLGRKWLSYKVQENSSYNLGDKVTFKNHEYLIYEKMIHFKNGEHSFVYMLSDDVQMQEMMIYNEEFAGLGLIGKVKRAEGEALYIDLELDQGQDRGEHPYPWIPEHGNAMYAMPEPGAGVMLYFDSVDERDGFVIHCIEKNEKMDKREMDYHDRFMAILDENNITLTPETLGFTHHIGQNIKIGESDLSVDSSKNIEISARKHVKLKAKKISVYSPNEICIYQGN